VRNEKSDEYAVKLMAHIQEIFTEDCENSIDVDELSEGDNLTQFVHALANTAPAMIVNRITGEKYDALGFNHMANRLAAQFSNFVDEICVCPNCKKTHKSYESAQQCCY